MSIFCIAVVECGSGDVQASENQVGIAVKNEMRCNQKTRSHMTTTISIIPLLLVENETIVDVW